MINEEDDLNAERVDAAVKCDNLKAKYNSYVGPREKELLDALELIKVARQAYHGNVFVGNHCVKVLKNYSTLTNVLRDEALKDAFNELFASSVRL